MGNFIYGKNTVTAYLRSNANAKVLYLFNKGSYNDLIGLAKKAKQHKDYDQADVLRNDLVSKGLLS